MHVGGIHSCLLSHGMLSTKEWESTANVRSDPMDQREVESRGFTERVHDILLVAGMGGESSSQKERVQ